MEEHNFTAESKIKVRDVMKSHSSVRRMLSPYDGEPTPEISWLATLPPSSTKLCELIEGACYGDIHDSSLKTAVKAGKGVSDVMEYKLVQEISDLDFGVELSTQALRLQC